MMSLTRTLIRHAPTDYSSLFVRGLPASIDAEEVRRYFCEKGYRCSVSFNKINNEYRKLYVALQFDSDKLARDVLNKYDNEQVLGYNVGLSYYKDKNRMYRDNGGSDYRSFGRARVGHPVDKRRFNRTPSVSPPRSRRRRSRSRSKRSRSHSRHSDSDRSHRSRSHSGSSSPRRRHRSSSTDRRSRSHSSSRSRSRSVSPKRRHSRSPKESESSRHRRSESPSHSRHSESPSRRRHSESPSHRRHSSRRHSSGRHSISPKKETTKHRSPSPDEGAESPYSPTHSPRKRTKSRSRSSSTERAKTPPESTKRKLSVSPNRKSPPSPAHSTNSKDESPSKKSRQSSEPTFPSDDGPVQQEESKVDQLKHSTQVLVSQKQKDPRRKPDMPEGDVLASQEPQSDKIPEAAPLNSNYEKVESHTDIKVPPKTTTTTSSVNTNKVPNGNKRTSDDADDVEADLRAEFLNNNDALYDSHDRTQAAGFPLVSRNKAEKILDDLPIDPLSDGQQYVSRTVEREFDLSNGDKGGKHEGKQDAWTTEMISKLKVKKEEIIQAYKQDCDTFTTVVKMLISKDPDLEMRLQSALKENLKEIGQRCVEELNQVADALKTDAK